MTEPRQITVTRLRGKYAMYRKLRLVVDGVEVGQLGMDDSVEITVPSGAPGAMIGRMDWAKTEVFDLHQVPQGRQVRVVPARWSVLTVCGIGGLPFKIEPDDG